ncbi:hypothetical protein M9458_039006, partial [Cirrhinus mrigala]
EFGRPLIRDNGTILTRENPADYASRGLTIEELINSNWLTGPRFLWEKEVDAKQ